jgi:putative ABC transport system substrate-binding protein
MRRRDFITLIGGALASQPLSARAQQSKVARIGVLYIGTADAESFKKELREGLGELGYVEGQHIAFEFRSAEGKLDRLPELAAELVRLKLDVIVTLYVPPSLAAKQATRDIPIVVIVGDPVKTGIVPSLAHPGGNITGVSLMASALGGKSVELFRDMMPSARRVGVLGHATNPVFAKAMLDEVLLAGGPTGLEIQPVVMIRGPDELESAFTTIVRERADALVVQGSLAIKPVTDMAIKYRVPASSTARVFADIGGLMSFGADGPAAFRHGAKFVQRISTGQAA